MKKLFLLIFCFLISAHTVGATDPSSDQKWEPILEEKNLKVFQREYPGSSIFEVRGEAVVRAPFIRVITVLKDVERRKEWVQFMKEAKVLKKLEGMDTIQYIHTSPPWPIQDRDVLLKSTNHFDPKTGEFVVFNKGIQLEEHPEREDRIRTLLNYAKMKIKALGEKRTHITLETHMDPRGGIPKWFVNMMMTGWPKSIVKALGKQARRSDLKIHPDLTRLLNLQPSE